MLTKDELLKLIEDVPGEALIFLELHTEDDDITEPARKVDHTFDLIDNHRIYIRNK